jgi:predicted MFS family arabinose efflux permease
MRAEGYDLASVLPCLKSSDPMTSNLTPQRERVLLIVLMLVQFTTIVDFMIVMPLSPHLISEFGIITAQFGLLVSSYSVAAGISALLAASIADRFDRRIALLATYVGLLVSTLGCALASSYHWLLLARAVAGIFGGVLGSITLAIVGDVIAPQRRGHAMGMVMLGFSLAAVAGVPAGLLIAGHFGWRAPFMALCIACALVWLAALRVTPSVRGHLVAQASGPRPGLFKSYGELLSVPNHWWAFLVTALAMFAGFLVIPYLAPSMVANVGVDKKDLAYIYLVGGAVTLFSRPWIGRLTDRFPHARVFAWMSLASFVPIVLITHSLQLPLAGQLCIVAVFFIFVSGRFIPAAAMVTGATEPRLRGRVMAFNAAVQNFAAGLAAFVAGVIMTTGAHGELLHYDWVGYLSCIIGLGAIWAARHVKAVS